MGLLVVLILILVVLVMVFVQLQAISSQLTTIWHEMRGESEHPRHPDKS